MRIKAEEWPAHSDAIARLYLVCGDEPVLVEEAVTQIVTAARAAGFLGHERTILESGFSWPRFRETLSSPSLFAARSIQELRVREGREGLARELPGCLPHVSSDTVLLVVTGALERSALKAQWVEACARFGHVVTVAVPEGPQLVAWVRRRLAAIGLHEDDLAQRIAYYAEGNMGAACDAIARLKDEPRTDPSALAEILVDEARFDVFAVVEAALAGDLALTVRRLRRLHATARDPILMSWALMREIRLLAKVSALQARGKGPAEAFGRERVWPKRQAALVRAASRLPVPAVRGLLKACARLDRVNKGRAHGDSWILIEELAMGLAGMPGRVA